MSLINIFEDAGEGIVTSKSTGKRIYRVGDESLSVDYLETSENESRSWVGISQQCAINQVAAAPQPTGSFESYTWSTQEDSRVIGSYIVNREYSKTSRVLYSPGSSPQLAAPVTLFSNYNLGVVDKIDFENINNVNLDTVVIRGDVASAFAPYAKLKYRYSISDNGYAPNISGTWPFARYYTNYAPLSQEFSEATIGQKIVHPILPSLSSRYATRTSSDAQFGNGRVRLVYIVRLEAYVELTVQSTVYRGDMMLKYINYKSQWYGV